MFYLLILLKKYSEMEGKEILRNGRQRNTIFQKVRDACICHWKPVVFLERLPAGVPSPAQHCHPSSGILENAQHIPVHEAVLH